MTNDRLGEGIVGSHLPRWACGAAIAIAAVLATSVSLAQEAPSQPAPVEPAPAEPPPAAPAGNATAPAAGGAARVRNVPLVGRGKYHPFEKEYVLAGVNFQGQADHGTVLEFEASFVPFISDSLWWFGAWGAIGGRTGQQDGPRLGSGLEMGWRFLAFDAGWVWDDSELDDGTWPDGSERKSQEHGVRLRLGGAFAMDLTAGCATYKASCCDATEGASSTDCECDRMPLGMTAFVYWAQEYRFNTSDVDNMFGVSLKFGMGL